MTAVFAEVDQIPVLLEELAVTYEALPANPFLRAAWTSQAIGAIHPFVDNNGGTARFLSSIELSRACLPPLVLTKVQRNTTYADAVVRADEDEIGPLTYVVYDVVQQELAQLLTSGPLQADDWPTEPLALADAWVARADTAWRAASSFPSERETGDCLRFVRRGYRTPHLAPKITVWAATTPVPTRFELSVSPVRVGNATWTIASILASVGEDGDLAPQLIKEPIATVFVAAPTENESDVHARFDHWLATRIDQTVRGLAAWM
jgi:hypothetical protein